MSQSQVFEQSLFLFFWKVSGLKFRRGRSLQEGIWGVCVCGFVANLPRLTRISRNSFPLNADTRKRNFRAHNFCAFLWRISVGWQSMFCTVRRSQSSATRRSRFGEEKVKQQSMPPANPDLIHLPSSFFRERRFAARICAKTWVSVRKINWSIFLWRINVIFGLHDSAFAQLRLDWTPPSWSPSSHRNQKPFGGIEEETWNLPRSSSANGECCPQDSLCIFPAKNIFFGVCP